MKKRKADTAYIALGSNKGDKLAYLKAAVKSLDAKDEITVDKVSSVYETKPWGIKEQENFFNAAAKIKTSLTFYDLFLFLKEIENKIGREKTVRFGPREIDLDLIFFNDLIYSDDRLTIPHKGVTERDFVLVPLCEIDSSLIHPELNVKICDICIEDSEKSIIRKIPEKIL